MNLLFSRGFKVLETVRSTNEYISNRIQNNSVCGHPVIFANYQTNGKGNRGKKWESEAKKNILMSFAFKSSLKLDEQFKLNVFVSIGLHEFLYKYFKDLVIIKWPNDILINSSKIGGILIENKIVRNNILYSIIGVGINVNQESFHDYNPKATSFFLEKGIDYNISVLRQELLDSINSIYIKFLKDYPSLLQKYLNLLHLKGITSKFLIGDKKITGKIINVSPEGKLVIELDRNLLKEYSYGEVQCVF
ncbi:MAG: biotin--[acetyl-CoA-carboxylase] ligase [Bacteroidota bacterium]|nr:biotin--[acetyl-CoA-carboxylase] ligase [Bacteroidota bacterium]